MFSSKEYLPENLKSDKQVLFNYLTQIVDYVIETYSTDNLEKLKAIYDPYHSWTNSDGETVNYYDPDYIIRLLGNPNFSIYENLNEEERRNFSSLVANLYRLKGTEAGVLLMLQLLEFTEIKIYEWFYVNEQNAEGNPKFPDLVDECTAVIEIVIEGIIEWDDLEDQILDLLQKMLWVCITYEMWWLKQLEDNYYLAQCYDNLEINIAIGGYNYYSMLNMNNHTPLVSSEEETEYDLVPGFPLVGPVEDMVTIGSATGTTNFPLETTQTYHRTQVVYLQASIGLGRKIEAIALDVTQIPGTTFPGIRLEDFTIRMANFAGTTATWQTGIFTTIFYRPFFYIKRTTLNPPSGAIWFIFDLDTPFDYNGSDNLMVDFSFQLVGDGPGGSDGVVNATAGSGIHYGDNVAVNPLTWSGSTPTPVVATDIPDIKIYSPLLQGGDLTTGLGGSASASSNHGSHPPANAVDDDADHADSWHTLNGSALPSWWKIDLGSNELVIEYTLQMSERVDLDNRMPKDWILEGSTDDIIWNTVDTVTGETGWTTAYEKRVFTADTPGNYRYYKISISDNNGSASFTMIPEVEMFGQSVEYIDSNYIVDEDDFNSDRLIIDGTVVVT